MRAIQLAKAALRAGIDLLVEHAGSPTVTDIRLAGAFGAHIDPVHAMVLGLVPDCPVDGVRSVGNAAGAGAVQALLSRRLRAEMETAVRRVIKIETATEPRFQELFVAAMALPHATARRRTWRPWSSFPFASLMRRVAGAVGADSAPSRRPMPASRTVLRRVDDVQEMSWRMCHERSSRASRRRPRRPPGMRAAAALDR